MKEWHDLISIGPDLDGWLISTDGELMGPDGLITKQWHAKDRENGGRKAYTLAQLKLKNGKTITRRVDRLMVQIFSDEPINKLIVRHKDGNKSNNQLANLEFLPKTRKNK